MSLRVYVDTNIIIDFLTERKSSSFFQHTLQCEFTIIISHFTLYELKRNGFDASTLISWLSFAEKCTVVPLNDQDKNLAKTLPTHYADALHAACAIRLQVDFLLTRNVKDFTNIDLTVNIQISYDIFRNLYK